MISIGNNDFANRLLMFDGHALAFHGWFTSYPNEVRSGFFDLLEEGIRKFRPSHVLVAFDPAPPTFRHLIYPEYKANRPPVPEQFLEECDEVRSELDSLKISNLTVEGYEADDVLGTVSQIASEAGFEIRIITVDLDLLQLVSAVVTVEIFSQYWATRLFDVEATRQRFNGLEPACVPDYKALVGDVSDNLPGVRGIGELSAKRLFSRYRNLEEIYQDLENVCDMPFRGAKRLHRILKENREQAFLMRVLATIDNKVCLGSDFDLGSTIYSK